MILVIKIKKKIIKYKKFLLGYSGGIDSTVLLYQLIEIKKKNNITIRAIHIDHQIHPESKKWRLHCQKICQIHKIPFIYKKILLNTKNKNIESEARKKRYKIFKQNLQSKEILLTGHNLNDQCETLLLAIKRGSGPKGLSGIAYKKKFFKNYLIRPLLSFSRQEIEIWAKYKKIKWIEDKSNQNTSYERNFLRHKILPQINQKWKFFFKNCLRTTKLIYSEHKLLNKFIKPIFKKNLLKKKILNIKNIKKMDIDIQYFIIRKWINLQGMQMPTLKFLKSILKNVIHNKKKKNPRIEFKKNEIWNYQNKLFWLKKTYNIQEYIVFWHNIKKKIFLPKKNGYLKIKKKIHKNNVLNIQAPKQQQLVNIRFYTNQKIQINTNIKKLQNIKKIFNKFKIPPWKRKITPLLFYDNKFISIIGIFSTQEKYNIDCKKISIIWNHKKE
ncbi:tRNA lysidine(34) synthetase TilS [Buchnera aphidicola]|uniref:tRNA lysidine(34) synthetase TilS n=1 Tax=Buchnera aphidicola TaxID=9 RepID=UPI002237AFB9|nr:tRNA lysidine(34) synthetase TilS [Buchnera aphidicola]MCW5197620.1 tRNA lysidine(34) synthetase TilS [Buchnera aphidicola (Chaitophorus viminalis)]